MNGVALSSIAFAVALLATSSAVGADAEVQANSTQNVSPRLAEILASALPRYESPPAPPAAASAPLGFSVLLNPSPAGLDTSSVVRMSDFIVGGQKLPPPTDVMSKPALERYAMRKYLGEEQGLNRALNMFTVDSLWRKIPVLGKVPFVLAQSSGRSAELPSIPRNNAERAMQLYKADKRAQQIDQLSGLSTSSAKSATKDPSKD